MIRLQQQCVTYTTSAVLTTRIDITILLLTEFTVVEVMKKMTG